jgi:DNA-binding MarR family transcriptional regulator
MSVKLTIFDRLHFRDVTPDSAPRLASGSLALAFLRASDALNGELLKRLEVDGWPLITQNQSLVFAYLSTDGTTASALARLVGITRQSMHKLLEQLRVEKLILLKSHPEDARSSLVVLSAKGHRLMTAAHRHLVEIEFEISNRIGATQLAQLRKAMAHDWTSMFSELP